MSGAAREGGIAGAGSKWECKTGGSRSWGLALLNEEGLQSWRHIHPGTTLIQSRDRGGAREWVGEVKPDGWKVVEGREESV